MIDTTTIPLRSHVLTKMSAPCVARAALVGDEDEPSANMDKGSTTHALCFNTQTVVVYPGAARKGKEWDKFAEEHDGCRIVLRGEYELASRMSEVVRRHPLARRLLENAALEQTRLFQLDGRLCRGTPDIVGPDYIADLKTGRSADPRRFRYHARDYHYDCSLAWYMKAVPTATRAFIICVEKTKPYPVSVFAVNARTLAQGDAYNMDAFARFRACEQANHWPEYSDQIIELDVPERSAAWAGYTEAEAA